MLDGEWLRALLESVGWGFGASHMDLLPAPCPTCNGTRNVGPPQFPIHCPACSIHTPS
jgi:hypothetical protein